MGRQSVLAVLCLFVLMWLTETQAKEWKSVSVGPSGVWGVDSADVTYYNRETYNFPTRLSSSWVKTDGLLKQMDVGYNIVWGVNKIDRIFYRRGISPENPMGSYWQRVEGSLSHVTVSPNGNVWGVDKEGDTYFRMGISAENPIGYRWQHVWGGHLTQISAGYVGVWGIDEDNDVYYRKGTYGDTGSKGHAWVKVGNSKFSYVTAGDAQVLAVDQWGRLFRRLGVTSSVPMGTRWRLVEDHELKVVDTYRHVFWGTGTDDNIYYGTV